MVTISEQTLQDVVRRLVTELQPDRIYLFGSQAYGNPGPGSDLDLAVLLPHNGITLSQARHRAGELVGHIGCGVDVFVYAAERFDRRSGWRANFEHTIRNKGRLLYGVDGIAYAREWIEKAVRDREAAELLRSSERPLREGTLFHCQQAVEKILKALLVYHNEPFEKVHDLGAFCALCEKIDPGFGNLRDQARFLNPYAVDVRYPDDPMPTAHEVEQGFDVLQTIWDFTVLQLPEELRKVAAAKS